MGPTPTGPAIVHLGRGLREDRWEHGAALDAGPCHPVIVPPQPPQDPPPSPLPCRDADARRWEWAIVDDLIPRERHVGRGRWPSQVQRHLDEHAHGHGGPRLVESTGDERGRGRQAPGQRDRAADSRPTQPLPRPVDPVPAHGTIVACGGGGTLQPPPDRVAEGAAVVCLHQPEDNLLAELSRRTTSASGSSNSIRSSETARLMSSVTVIPRRRARRLMSSSIQSGMVMVTLRISGGSPSLAYRSVVSSTPALRIASSQLWCCRLPEKQYKPLSIQISTV